MNGSLVTEIFVPVEMFVIGTDMYFICLTFLPWNGDSYKDVDADHYDDTLYAVTDFTFIYPANQNISENSMDWTSVVTFVYYICLMIKVFNTNCHGPFFSHFKSCM
jgi:hypothetical protein